MQSNPLWVRENWDVGCQIHGEETANWCYQWFMIWDSKHFQGWDRPQKKMMFVVCWRYQGDEKPEMQTNVTLLFSLQKKFHHLGLFSTCLIIQLSIFLICWNSFQHWQHTSRSQLGMLHVIITNGDPEPDLLGKWKLNIRVLLVCWWEYMNHTKGGLSDQSWSVVVLL